MRRAAVVLLVLVVGASWLTACEIRPHHDFTVGIGTDAVDAVPGDGTCEATAGSGDCTLRAAIGEVNALVAAAVGPVPTFEIALATDVLLTIANATEESANVSGDLDMRLGAGGSLTIRGDGHAVAAVQAFRLIDRVFELHAGTLTLDDIVVANGIALEGGGGIRTEPDTNLVVTRSTFRDNLAGDSNSGCLVNPGDPATCVRILTPGGGGAIDAAGNLVVSYSTFSRNHATPVGTTCQTGPGGLMACPSVWGGAILARSAFAVVASTFDANSIDGHASAIWAQGPSTVVSATVVQPGAAFDGAVVATDVRSSILAREGCSNVAPDANGNLVEQAPCVAGALGLAPLADNGGATQTRLPVAGSIFLDASAPDGAGTCGGFTLDQRDLPRPSGAGCDVGAVERQPSDP